MVEKNVPALNKKGVLGKLVHVQGSLKGQTLQDKQYGVEVKNALSLRRGTEMYQWVEEEEPNESNDERFVTYRHHTEWVGSHVDTRSFRDKKSAGTYKNPARPSLQPFEDRVRTIEVGELKTSPEFSPKLLRFKPLDIKRPNDKDSFSRSVAMVKKIPRNYVLRHMCESDVCQGVLYSSAKAVSQPEVGDARVRFQYAPAGGTVSLIGLRPSPVSDHTSPKMAAALPWRPGGRWMLKSFSGGLSLKTVSGRGSCAVGASFWPSWASSSS